MKLNICLEVTLKNKLIVIMYTTITSKRLKIYLRVTGNDWVQINDNIDKIVLNSIVKNTYRSIIIILLILIIGIKNKSKMRIRSFIAIEFMNEILIQARKGNAKVKINIIAKYL